MIHVHMRRTYWSSEETGYHVQAWRSGLSVRDVAPNGIELDHAFAWRNNALAQPDDAVQDGDHVTFAPQPYGFIGVGAVKFLFWLAASTVLNLMMAPRLPPRKRGEEQSPTYGFGGISTARGEGFPIPIIYGRHRVGGVVVSEVLESEAFPPKQTYRALISLGLGPYYAIGNVTTNTAQGTVLSTSDPSNPIPTGIEINGNRAETYDDVEVQVRLGAPGQLTIPGYEFADTNVEVGQTLTSPTTSSASNSTTQLSITTYKVKATSDTVFSAYARTQDYYSDEVDAARVTITFPYGLYTYDQTTGGLASSNFQLCARYIELDNAGTPITSGGPEADGYVRLPPFDMLAAAQQGQFSIEYPIAFVDPQTYAHDTPGEAINFDGTNDVAEIATPTLPSADPVTGANLNTAGSSWGEMTVAAWVRLDDATRSGNYILDHIAGWTGVTPRGFRFGIKRKTFFAGIGYTVPTFEIGDSSDTLEVYEGYTNPSGTTPTFALSESTWYHVAVTYIRNSSGSSEKIKLYGNGKLRATFLVDQNLASAGSAAAVHVGHTRDSSVSGTSAFMDGRVDELVWTNRAMSAQEIAGLYNGGSGKYAAQTGYQNPIGIWHFDTSSGATAWTTPDAVTGGAGALTMYTSYSGTKGDLLTSSGSGKVYVPAANTPKRGRWRLELVRNNYDSTSASTQDQADWSAVAWRIDEAFSYPGHALLAIGVKASEQMNDTIPDVTAKVDGRIVGVWDGASTTNPTFSYTWTANPAWIALDYALDKISGLGSSFASTDIDILSFSSWAKVCDQLVYGHHGQYADGAGVGWLDMVFVGTAGVGTLGITFDADKYTRLRQYLEVGDYIGLTGVNIVDADINTPEGNRHDEVLPTRPGGWRIIAFNDAGYAMTLAINVAPTNPFGVSGTALSAAVGGAANLTGTVEDREFRHRCNLVIDEQRPAWDWLLTICATGRARPVRDGRRLRVVWDSPKGNPVDLVTQSSILPGSFEIEYGGSKDRPNAYSVDIYDADQNWERSTFPIEHPSVQNATTQDALVTESKTFQGITSRAQAMRQSLYELNSNYLLQRSGRFKTNVSGLPLEPGDLINLAHDLAGWSLGGRVASGASTASLTLDRDVTVTSAVTVHTITVKDSNTGTVSTANVDAVATGSGGYPRTVSAGGTITLSSALSFLPQQGDEYAYTTPSAASFDAQVVGTKLEHDGTKTIEWIEYDANVYDDDEFGDLTEVEAATSSASSQWTVPPEATYVGVASHHETAAGGQHVQVLTASWDLERSTLLNVRAVAVWWRSATDDADQWRKVAEVDSSISSATFRLPSPTWGQTIQVAVQPISRSGARLKPESCAHAVVRLEPIGPAPGAPSALSATMDHDHAIYRWTPNRRDRLLFTELRRGGWILGQLVGVSPPGVDQLTPTRDWAGGPDNDFGESDPTTYARHVSATGSCSAPVSLVFSPSVDRTFALGQFDGESQCAEDSWATYATLTDMATFTLPDGRTGVRFSGSALTGYIYWPATPVTSLSPSRTRRAYVEAFVSASQVHPWAFASWPGMDSPALRNWSMEGPLVVQDGETENCTCTLEIKVADDTGSGSWKPYRPGIYRTRYCQMRAVFTRPDTTYDVHVYRASLRVLRVPVDHNSESGLDSRARSWAVPG